MIIQKITYTFQETIMSLLQYIYKETKIRKKELAINIYVGLLNINGFYSIKYIKAQIKHYMVWWQEWQSFNDE